MAEDVKVPEGWRKVRLGEIIEKIGDGGTPPREDPTNFGGGIPWVVIDDIKKRILTTKETLSKKGLKRSSAKLWRKGSIILSFGATIGEVGIAQVELATKQGIAGIEVKANKVCNEFLYFVLLTKKQELIRYANGTTIKEIRPETIKEKIEVSLPPLTEQRKIAEVLETVDNAIEKTEKIIEKYKRIKQGLMQELLTKGIDENGQIRSEETHRFKDSPLGRIPEEWEVVELGEVGKIASGSTPDTSKPEFWDGNIIWITPDDLSKLNTRYIHTSKRRITEKGLKNCSAKLIPPNSIVISSRAPIGYLAISKVRFATNQGCKSIILNSSNDPDFFYYCLHIYKKNDHFRFRNYFQRNI